MLEEMQSSQKYKTLELINCEKIKHLDVNGYVGKMKLFKKKKKGIKDKEKGIRLSGKKKWTTMKCFLLLS